MVSVCQHDAAAPFSRNPRGVANKTRISLGEMWNRCCRSISCWALSRYAQWIVERCSDPQQDTNAAQLQLDEVLQVLLSVLPAAPFSAPFLPSVPSLPSALSFPSALFPCPFPLPFLSALSLCLLLSALSLCPSPLPCLSALPASIPFLSLTCWPLTLAWPQHTVPLLHPAA